MARRNKIAAAVLSAVLHGASAQADTTIWSTAGDGTAVQAFGDFRFRLEQDWDSRNSDGIEREDRARARMRARLGMRITIQDDFELLARIRTGSKYSRQSPHIIVDDFDGNGTGDKDGVFDKFYAKINGDQLWLWGGRNELPCWKQTESFWDDDVILLGGSAGFNHPHRRG